jgi:hypothetical protein
MTTAWKAEIVALHTQLKDDDNSAAQAKIDALRNQLRDDSIRPGGNKGC